MISSLRTQAQNNRALAENLIEQQRKQQEASQALAQESVNAYMDFLNSVFARPRAGAQTARRAAQEEGDVSLRGTSGDVRRGTTPDAPITPPDEAVPPDAFSPPGSEERTPREATGRGEARAAKS